MPAPLELSGIESNREAQIALWKSWQPMFADPHPGTMSGCRYKPTNNQFGPGDALVLACMLRHLKPARVIEAGSGYSSAVALDTAEYWLADTQFTFVDPHPRRLLSLLKPADHGKLEILRSKIQDVDPVRFEQLESGDVLFIDSTHIVKTASDVVWELFQILPRLNSDVFIHFLDVFWPFEYPSAWVVGNNRSWKEIYALRAFLSYNNAFEIVFWATTFGKPRGSASYPAFPS